MPTQNLNLTKPVKEFIRELNGRYREYVSDAFLEVLIVESIATSYSRTKNAIISNIAYDVGCEIFETLMECRLRAGGNGHHVAQALADKLKE